MKSRVFLVTLSILALGICESKIIIHNATDLINLSNNVSSGSSYSGTTILLDADIDFDGFSGIFEPIGKDEPHYFYGTFDGQGHTIKNLAMNSSLVYTGFFGCAKNATFKNIVFDWSCSFLSRNSSYSNFVTLGPISYFTFSGEEYGIENIVNMASITFTGLNVNYIDAGGIAGKMNSNSFIRNCVNYGNITIIGSSTNVYVGGIVGEFIANANKGFSLKNCINYGNIQDNCVLLQSKNGNIYAGGIVGYTQYSFLIDSCVGAGEISSSNGNVGGIIGGIYDSSSTKCIINNSYWTSDISGYNKQFDNHGDIKSSHSESVEKLDEITLNKLNGGSSSSSGDDNAIWLLNSNGKTVTFFVNDKVYLTSTSPMILMPSFDKDNFDGWYTNNSYTTLFTSSSVTSDANFYGIYKSQVTVMFDANGGNLSDSVSSSITVIYSEEYGGLPGATRTEHRFDGWFTAPVGGNMITADSVITDSESHTLYAHWTLNTYTVTFDFANGTTLNSTFGYNQPIDYPENEGLIREGYTFNGWDKEIDFMPAHNITITANWTNDIQQEPTGPKNTLEYVEIVFGNKDLSKEEIEKIIRAYTDDTFEIKKFESDDDNTIRVIIKFTDAEKAENFVETIKGTSTNEIIISTNYITFVSVGSTLQLVSLFLLSLVL